MFFLFLFVFLFVFFFFVFVFFFSSFHVTVTHIMPTTTVSQRIGNQCNKLTTTAERRSYPSLSTKAHTRVAAQASWMDG